MNAYQERILMALGASLLLHFAAVWFYASATITQALSRWFASISPPRPAVVLSKKDQERLQARRKPVPKLSFVEVDASQASTVRPPDARFYSDRSSLAANPKPSARSTDVPKIEGRKLDRLETTTVRSPGRAQPAPARKPATPTQPTPARVKAMSAQTFEFVMRAPLSKTFQKSRQDGITSPELARRAGLQPKTAAAGSEMPQLQFAEPTFSLRAESSTSGATEREIPAIASQTDAGVERRGPVALNVVGMPQGAYSKKMFAEIGRRWTLLLEQYYADGQPGKVRLGFTLYPTGRVDHLKVALNTGSGILASYCEKSVVDSAPFDRWPEELKLLGGDHLDITIDFNVYLYER